jgi:4-amino-4-deoxy-L-arabinose transferase-like glycosyltransferase
MQACSQNAASTPLSRSLPRERVESSFLRTVPARPEEVEAASPMPETLSSTSSLQRHLYGGFGLTLLIALYLLPGSVGHDPWRGDDIQHFSIIHGMLRGEGWLFPTLAGDAETAFPPLYYWTGALFVQLLGWILPVHDAARIATPFFAGMAIFWTSRAAARLYGKHTRTPAALLTLGTLGFVVHAHENQPMMALVAMQAMVLAGLAMLPAQPLKGSIQAALGVALALLAAGPAGLLLTLPLFLITALCAPECRNPRASGAHILGVGIALGASALWPLMLHYNAPDLLVLWWMKEWATFGSTPLSTTDLPRLLELLGWFIWPLWPIALWSLWRARRHLINIAWLLPLASIAFSAILIHARGSYSPEALLPLIPPCTLLAAAGVPTLRRGAANAFDWFAVMTFAVFGLLVWLAWSAQVVHWPPGLARSIARMSPDFVLHGTQFQATLGITICVVWALLVWKLPRSPNRGPSNWAMGMTMLWLLAVTLLLPWFDYSRNYRPVATAIAAALPGDTKNCLAALGLSASHRAALDYFADIRPVIATRNETHCPLLLVRDDHGPVVLNPDGQWRQIWEFRHGGGKKLELFRLYQRD